MPGAMLAKMPRIFSAAARRCAAVDFPVFVA
jgi:hypothetical protein